MRLYATLLFVFPVAVCFAQIPLYVPGNGLLAWYPFSGNANDIGPSAHNGTVSGAVLTSDRFNTQNAAYLYDGINDYISIADNVLSFRPQNLTISSWVRFNIAPSGHRMIIAKNVNGNTPAESVDMNYAGQLSSWFCNIGTPVANGPYLTPSYPVSAGTWYHVVYQFDDLNNRQQLYVNGVFTASSAVNSSVGYDNNVWTIGAEFENGSLGYFFNGRIDDIGIWDRVLMPCEINNLYLGTVNSSSVGATASAAGICAGQSVTLTAQGASGYTWAPGNITGTTIVVTPSVSTVFSVTGVSGNGCLVSSGPVSVSVQQPPMITAQASPSQVCQGIPVTLLASGANSYTWNPVVMTGAMITDSPSVTTIYSVQASDASGCVVSAFVAVIVDPLPVVQIVSSSSIVCAGHQVTLTASGAFSYTWNSSANSPVIVDFPSIVNYYSVYGTGANGCVGAAFLTQLVSTCIGINAAESEAVLNQPYPNPFHDELFFPDLITGTISVMNVTGSTIWTSEATNAEALSTASLNWPAGIYFVSYKTNDNFRIFRLVHD